MPSASLAPHGCWNPSRANPSMQVAPAGGSTGQPDSPWPPQPAKVPSLVHPGALYVNGASWLARGPYQGLRACPHPPIPVQNGASYLPPMAALIASRLRDCPQRKGSLENGTSLTCSCGTRLSLRVLLLGPWACSPPAWEMCHLQGHCS